MPDSNGGSRNGGSVLPVRSNVATVGRYATRYPSSTWLELLARQATAGAQGAEALIATAAQPTVADPGHLIDFAFVLAACANDDRTVRAAAELFTAAMSHAEGKRVDQRTAGVWLQTLHLSGMLEDAVLSPREEDVGAQTWWGVQTDRENPFRCGASTPAASESATWLSQFSRPFTDQGRQGLSVLPGTGAPFDRLTARAGPPVDGPLVSVIVPVHNPAPGLLSSVRSVLDQTWTNLDVLICDDGSTTGREYLAACAELGDDRVRVLRMATNRGRYAALNYGLAHANGRYVTFQDADDYAHPARIAAHLVRHLADEPTIATTSHAVRASAQLTLTSTGMRLVTTNASSFLFEREPVLARLGGYDTVRKAGDTEFINRCAAAFGAERLHRMDDVLAVIQTTPNSLSRGELGFLRRHPARQAYRAAADAWHEKIRAGADPYVVPGTRAPFPAPAHITGSPPTAAKHADIVLLTSVTCAAPTRTGAIAAALAEDGTEVTVVEFVGPRDALAPAPGAPDLTLARLMVDGRLRWALPGETAPGWLALLDDPEALLVMPLELLRHLQVEAMVVVFEDRHEKVLTAVTERLARLEPIRPVWLPATATAAHALHSAATGYRILDPARWWVGVDPGPISAPPAGEAPVVGMVSGRFTTLPPAQVRPRQCLPRDPHTSLWSWGPAPAQLLGRPVHRVSAITRPWREFIRQVDYFIAPSTGTIGTLVMDAWSSGATVLAADSMRDILGDRALYPGRRGADALVHDGMSTARERALASARSWADAEIGPEALRRSFSALGTQLSQ